VITAVDATPGERQSLLVQNTDQCLYTTAGRNLDGIDGAVSQVETDGFNPLMITVAISIRL